MTIFRSIGDNLKLIMDHLSSSYRYIILATLGLIIAISVLSSSILYINIQKSIVLNEIFTDSDAIWGLRQTREMTDPKNASLGLITNQTLDNFELLSKTNEYIEFTVSYFKNPNLLLAPVSSILPTNINITLDYLYEFENFDFFNDYFVNNSQKYLGNTENNDAILLLNKDTLNESDWIPTIESINEFVIPDSKNYSQSIFLNQVRIKGIIEISTSNLTSLEEKNRYLNAVFGSYSSGNILFVKNITKLFLNKEFIDSRYFSSTSINNIYQYYFDLTQFNSFQISNIVQDIITMESTLWNNLFKSGFRGYLFSNTLLQPLRQIESQMNQLYLNIILFALPVVLIAIFVSYYSFGLIRRQKVRLLGIYLSRGISVFQNFLFLFFEMVFSLIIAIIFGIILSFPMSMFVTQSSGFLEFNRPIYLSFSLLTSDLIILLAQYGIGLTLLINILQSISFLKYSIKDIDREAVEERENPFWKRKYLDLIFFCTGLIFYLITAYSIDLGSIIPVEMLSLFSLPSPIFIIIGSVMLTSRIFPVLTNVFSTYIWEKRGNLLAFSLKNISLRRFSTTRALILITMAFAFLVSFLSFPFSYLYYQETLISYTNGAEISLSFENPIVNYTYFNDLLENFTDKIEQYSPVMTADLSKNNIMIVNTSTFSKAAWMRVDFIQNLQSAMNNLKSDNSSILIQKENLVVRNQSIGSEFFWFSFQNDTQGQNQISFNFTVSGTFTYWPNLVDSLYFNPRTRLFGVMSFEALNVLEQKLGNSSENFIQNKEVFLYIKPKPDLNVTEFSDTIQKLDNSIKISVSKVEYNQLLNNIVFFLLIGQINSNVIFTLGIIILGVIMFGFMHLIERAKETATERAIGLTFRQNFRLIFYEIFWLVGIGILSGLLLGYFFSSLFLLSVNLGSGFPPFLMVYPASLIGGSIIFILIFSFLGSLIPAYYSSKSDITKLLRVE